MPPKDHRDAEIARLKAEIEKKDLELRAHRERLRTEKDLASQVKYCETILESRKNQVAAAKDDLGTAQQALANFVHGSDAQTTFLDEEKVEPPAEKKPRAKDDG